jgi:hypothetical protein
VDRITKALLTEYATDAGIAKLSEDVQFEHFAAYLNVGRHLSESFDPDDVVSGSGGDTGIDGIATIVNGTLVTDPELVAELADQNGYLDVSFVFVQAERSSSFDAQKIGNIGFGVADFFSEAPKLARNEAVKEAAAVMAEVFKLSSRFKRGNPTSRIYYVTTGKWTGDPTLDARRRAVVEDLERLNLFREVEFTPVDADAIRNLYNAAKNAIAREFIFKERSVVPEMPGVSEAYIGLVPATTFLELIQDENGDLIRSLFYDNVRDWQDYNSVNAEIKTTLESSDQRARFALMNNGVTVIAKTLRQTGHKVYIEDYQIVNGCQTSHVLHDQKEHLDATVLVPLRLIATKDESVISAIIKATNRQTEVKQEQLMALSDFQKKLENYFVSFDDAKKLYYERRSRQYNSLTGIEKTRIVTPANLIRAYASMFLDEPHRTTRTYRALLSNVGKEIFGANHQLAPYYAAAAGAYRLEYFFRNGTLDAKYKPARYHILLAARKLIRKDAPPLPNSNNATKYGDSLAEVFWDTAAAEKVFLKAAKIVEDAAKGDFHRDNIRTLPFTKDLIAKCEMEAA